LLLISGL